MSLTIPQVTALQLAFAPANDTHAVPYRRSNFISGHYQLTKTRSITVQTRDWLVRRGFVRADHPSPTVRHGGTVTLNEAARAAYETYRAALAAGNNAPAMRAERREKTMGTTPTTTLPATEPAPVSPKPPKVADAEPSKALLAAQQSLIELYPEDIRIDFPEGHALYQKTRVEDALDVPLLNDIREQWVKEMPHVRESPDEPGVYEIVDGRQRTRSARVVNEERVAAKKPRKKILCILEGKVKEDANAIEAKWRYNMRKPLTPFERAKGMKEFLDVGHDIPRVASFFGVNVKTVMRSRDILDKGIPELHKALHEGAVTLDAAMRITQLSKKRQLGALERAVSLKKTFDDMMENGPLAEGDGEEEGASGGAEAGAGDGAAAGEEGKEKKKPHRVAKMVPVVENILKTAKKMHKKGDLSDEDMDLVRVIDATAKAFSGGSMKALEDLLTNLGMSEVIELPAK